MNDDEKRKESDEVTEEVESINEEDLKQIIEKAIKDSQKENRRVFLTPDVLDKMVEDRLNEVQNVKLEKNDRRNRSKIKYNEFAAKRKVLKILEDEREKLALELASMDADDKDYKDVYDNFRKIQESYKDVKNNPLDRVDWSKVITTLIIIGAAGALVFLLLIIENSPYFPRSRNALNLIMNLVRAGIKL